MIALGLSGLPNAQRLYLERNPHADRISRRICQGLDSAACIVKDGHVVAAAAEERFAGVKGTGAFPSQAITYCLDEAGIGPGEIDVIAHGFSYDEYQRFFAEDTEYFIRALSGRTVIDELSQAGWKNLLDRFQPVRHHLAHAASSYYPSGFKSALGIVSDGMGEIESLSVFRIQDGQFDKLYSQDIRTSLGIFYSLCTRFLGFDFNQDEYKVMGLSAYGDPKRYRSLFSKLIDCQGGRISLHWARQTLDDARHGYPKAADFFQDVFGFPARRPGDEVQSVHADFAAALQKTLTDILVEFVSYWLRKTDEHHLCLAGGTFLNCKANESIAALPDIADLFIQPAAGDDGTALGAAMYAASNRGALSPRPATAFDPYLGPGYSSMEVAPAVSRAAVAGLLSFEYLGLGDDYLSAAAQDIAADRIIGWFHGRMEFGPRALGSRSILALPKGAEIKERLNALVKFREPFRPFSPAVLDTDFHALFEGRVLPPSAYMLCTVPARTDTRKDVAGAVHADGSSRVQIVTAAGNQLFHRLLEEVKRYTGFGCVINTSLNVKGQPLIMSPETAVNTFIETGLDRLYIEGYKLAKAGGRDD